MKSTQIVRENDQLGQKLKVYNFELTQLTQRVSQKLGWVQSTRELNLGISLKRGEQSGNLHFT